MPVYRYVTYAYETTVGDYRLRSSVTILSLVDFIEWGRDEEGKDIHILVWQAINKEEYESLL